MNSSQIRQRFLDFFSKKQHEIVSSAPIVLKDDPTLMFTNSGMNQFKDYFLGYKTPKTTRVADAQKCLRVSGKHNDLDDVGNDTYHHTMFEMLGNWSFGEYFKKEAIAWAWEFLIHELKIDKETIYVTVFEGDASLGLAKDQEAFDFWKQWIAEDRILNGNKKDNFWEMGETGPCGPCSEIHIDLRSEEEKARVEGKALVNQDHPEVIEVWNLVFMEFLRKADGSLEKLPNQHVDTGMGFERLAMVMQNKRSNYDTDVFTPLIHELEGLTQKKYNQEHQIDVAIRVVVDHVRAVAFAIADGQLPSNTGAGYVIRRILRRAIRYGFTFLDQKEPFIYKLVSVLVNQMGKAYPELAKQQAIAENVIKEEEISFQRTLGQGLLMLDAIQQEAQDKTISGKRAFELYDTYGFPFDLTALILQEKGYKVNHEEFDQELEKQKQRSRKAGEVKAGDWQILIEDDTEEFLGYDTLEAEVRIPRYRKVESAKKGTEFHLVFNLTPFYPEGGGQVGDRGTLRAPNGETLYINDTRKENNLIIHTTDALPSHLHDPHQASVSQDFRHRTESNHTATHLLHQALREILGEHVEQKGSKLDEESLRFDFSHFSKMTNEEIEEVEAFVNARIRDRIPLNEHRSLPFQEALDKGAMALFGEKYGDSVRMIEFGDSRELCGGTHVKNTVELWYFKIVSEAAVASGIRRIEAITNKAVSTYLLTRSQLLNEVHTALKNTQDPLKAIQDLKQENTDLKKEIQQLQKEQAKANKQQWKQAVETVGGKHFILQQAAMDNAVIKDLVFQLKKEVEDVVVVIANEWKGKPTLAVGVSDTLVEQGLHAGKLIAQLAKEIKGGGGGQAGFATAGGKDVSALPNVLLKAKELLY